jgi:hypothetical protein
MVFVIPSEVEESLEHFDACSCGDVKDFSALVEMTQKTKS